MAILTETGGYVATFPQISGMGLVIQPALKTFWSSFFAGQRRRADDMCASQIGPKVEAMVYKLNEDP